MTPGAHRPVLAADVGGTTITVALVADGRVLRRRRAATAATTERLWRQLAELLCAVWPPENAQTPAVAVACAGPLDLGSGTVSPVNIPAWRDFPLRDRLRQLYPRHAVTVLNDAVAAAYGESRRGAGRGSRGLLGVVVSTGVGGGIVIDGAPLLGPGGNAGHLGHLVVRPGGPRCGCGARGCLEAIASGPAMVRAARQGGWVGSDPRELAAAARGGDPVATAAFAEAGWALAVGFTAAAVLLELDRVVVGGGVAHAGDVLLPAIGAHLARLDHPLARGLTVVAAQLGDDAGVIGAAEWAELATRP